MLITLNKNLVQHRLGPHNIFHKSINYNPLPGTPCFRAAKIVALYWPSVINETKKMATLSRYIFVAVLLLLITTCKKSEMNTDIITDIDGNVYHTIVIGEQVWMVKNLRTTRFYDGTIIPNVIHGTEWSGMSTPAFCWFNNNDSLYRNTRMVRYTTGML
jgi:hypothetical protein